MTRTDWIVAGMALAFTVALVLLVLSAPPAQGAETTDYMFVFVQPTTDYTAKDLQETYEKETKKDAKGIMISGAGKARPEVDPQIRKRFAELGFTVAGDKSEVEENNGVLVQARILDEVTARKLNAEGAATVVLVPIVGFISALEKQARVKMRLDVRDLQGELLWRGEETKKWKSGFFGGLFTKSSKLRRKAREAAIKELAERYKTFAEAK